MWSRLAIALIWLLVAAVPVRATAVAAMLHCAPSQHGANQGHAVSSDHHDANAVIHGQHQGGAQAHSHSGLTPLQDSASDTGDLSKCSACASCCVGAALPGYLHSVALSPVPHLAQQPLLTPASDIYMVGPERPPRISLG